MPDDVAKGGIDLEDKREKALANSLLATDYYDALFSDDFTVEEWNALSEKERQEIIHRHYDELSEEFEQDYKSEAAVENSIALYNALSDALDASSDFAEDLDFEVLQKKFNSSGNSAYLKLWSEDAEESFTIRISDHEQPPGGSWYESGLYGGRENAAGIFGRIAVSENRSATAGNRRDDRVFQGFEDKKSVAKRFATLFLQTDVFT